MKISERLFPYPVLSPGYSDYPEAEFAAGQRAELTGDVVYFEFDMALRCPAIAGLISSGEAEYAVHIECSLTSHRELIRSAHPALQHAVRADCLRGGVESVALIIAAKDIKDYDGGGDLSPDFSGLRFRVPRGSILAYCPLPAVRLESQLAAGAAGPSVFVVYARTETGDVPMCVDPGQDSIMIGLSQKDFSRYSQMAGDTGMQPILNSMLVLPALVYVLDELRDEQMLEDCRDLGWFQTISRSLQGAGYSLDSLLLGEALGSMTTVEIAQMLMDSPLQRALTEAGSLSFDGAEEGAP